MEVLNIIIVYLHDFLPAVLQLNIKRKECSIGTGIGNSEKKIYYVLLNAGFHFH